MTDPISDMYEKANQGLYEREAANHLVAVLCLTIQKWEDRYKYSQSQLQAKDEHIKTLERHSNFRGGC